MKRATILAVLAALTFAMGRGGVRAGGPSLQPTPPATPTVPYSVIEQWNIQPRNIANGGYGRVVFVEPVHRSEAGLLALADQLRQDTSADLEAVVYIYDDSTAAKMRKDAGNEHLSYADMRWHDDHMIGIYTKIPRDGQPPMSLTMSLHGAGGPTKRVALP